jgi:hypothetical protein
VPALPSTSGVADVFAFQADGTVQAITSDGTVAWTANLGHTYYPGFGSPLPDFQGGLVVPGGNSIYKLDGITGQPYPAYQGSENFCNIAIHPDGTIFAAQAGDCEGPGDTVVGIDPITGAQKFSVTLPVPANAVLPYQGGGQMIIAGDGYAYYSYGSVIPPPDGLNSEPTTCYSSVLRIDSSGNYDAIPVFTSTCGGWAGGASHAYVGGGNLITNADQGILLTWEVDGSPEATAQTATITNGAAATVGTPQVPGGEQVYPVLQAQDGSFVGTTCQGCAPGYGNMVAFDASGNTRWIVPGDTPQIATADGGVIGQSGITYDQYGNATGMIAGLPVQSWTGNLYQDSPVDEIFADPYLLAWTFLALAGGEYSPGAAGYPVDSDTDQLVKGTPSKAGILSKQEWAKFKASNCAVVLGNKDYGLPSVWQNTRYPWDPSMNQVQRAQSELNFYDTGKSYWANMPLVEVLPEPYRKRYNPNETILQYLVYATASAATLVIPGPGPIPLAPGFFNQKKPQVDLIHEVLIHAYAGASDFQVENNNYFKSQGYWFDGKGSATISTWMSTDCKCTPENPANPPNSCPANTAKW